MITGIDVAVVTEPRGVVCAAIGKNVDMARDPATITGLRGARLAGDWVELCRWDPALPADNEPPLASSVVEAFEAALRHPQPLAWGDDTSFATAVESFLAVSSDLEVAVGQLVCLREAFRRVVVLAPADEVRELHARADMIIDRGIVLAVRLGVARLKEQALIDELTGLLNRRALDRDLPVELSRAHRYKRQVAVVVIDLDGLKVINDRFGHSAGDIAITDMGTAICESLREQDRAYRVGGDEFVVVLTETDAAGAAAVLDRIVAAGAPAFTAGIRVTDGADDMHNVLDDADRELIQSKRRAGTGRQSS